VRLNLKLLQTSTFRLSAAYLALFALSVGAILGYVYLNTAILIERQTDDTIRAEVQALADQYQLRGLTGIIDTVQRRSREETGSVYLLSDNDGKPVAGNLSRLPPQASKDSGWIEFTLDVHRGDTIEQHVIRAFHADLAGDYELVVGRDIEASRQFAAIIRATLFWAIGIALVLGLGGGLLMSRNFLNRVDAITDASRLIMGGDLTGRMPVSGSGDELDRLALALNQMLDQIERLMAAMQEVTSNVAHDLRTPLTRTKARVESALRSSDPTDYRGALDKTVEESDRLLQTFNALLSIAKTESGQARSGLAPIDARAVLNDVADLYTPMVEEQGGKLACEEDGAELPVKADRQLLAQAVSNLIDNALKYGAVNGNPPDISVLGRIADDHVVIEVGDRGGGIAEADRSHVVDRFVRLDESRSKPGNGLGLSLVAGVMKLHGGELVLEDNQPGLRAKLVLPLQRPAV
jgi:signal transduction histidine kinase